MFSFGIGPFDDENERIELSAPRLEPVLHELVANFIGEERIVQVDFWHPGNSAHDDVFDAGLGAAVMETESPSQPRPVVIQRTWISLTGD